MAGYIGGKQGQLTADLDQTNGDLTVGGALTVTGNATFSGRQLRV